MSDAARRKERKRLKREKKKQQMRRAIAGSPYKRIGQDGALEACYVNAKWESEGMASLYVIRRNPQVGMAMACFLIDLWCAGLKDAWGAIDMSSSEIDEHLKKTEDRFEVIRIEPDVARNLVAGAIRFSRQNGFRLPRHYERWTRVLGDLPEIATADLRPFGKDGGLLWVGREEDLRNRLIACSVEDFLSRPDVHYTMESSEFDEVDDEHDLDDAEFSDEFYGTVEQVVEEAEALCAARGEQPSPLMYEAAMALLAAGVMRIAMDEGGPQVNQSVENLIEQVEEEHGEEPTTEMKEAIEQLFRLMPNGPSSLQGSLPPPGDA